MIHLFIRGATNEGDNELFQGFLPTSTKGKGGGPLSAATISFIPRKIAALRDGGGDDDDDGADVSHHGIQRSILLDSMMWTTTTALELSKEIKKSFSSDDILENGFHQSSMDQNHDSTTTVVHDNIATMPKNSSLDPGILKNGFLHPSRSPSTSPLDLPSEVPSFHPGSTPSTSPLDVPFKEPSFHPSRAHSTSPSDLPSEVPSFHPSSASSKSPSDLPSEVPSFHPSLASSKSPLDIPTMFLPFTRVQLLLKAHRISLQCSFLSPEFSSFCKSKQFVY
jgi:hypothetical protein